MKIEWGNDKNELDVVFISKDNKLHIIECKALVERQKNSQVINDAIYKLKTLTTKFGLKVQGYVYTMAKKINKSCLDRTVEYNIQITDGKSI